LGRGGGGKRSVKMREVVNGLMYVRSTGCRWRVIPKDQPPKSTVYNYFDLWTWDGTLDRMHAAPHESCREEAGREAQPTAAIIESQSVKSAKKGGITDTQGLLMHAIVHSANIKDPTAVIRSRRFAAPSRRS